MIFVQRNSSRVELYAHLSPLRRPRGHQMGAHRTGVRGIDEQTCAISDSRSAQERHEASVHAHHLFSALAA
jgi:hypothetical protein